MNLWTAAVYVGASVIALQGLFALMAAHRQQALQRFFEEELQRRQAELDAQTVPEKVEPNAVKSGQRSKAA